MDENFVASRSSFADAVAWAADAATGTVATAIAMLAVGALGVMLLTGRVPARRAAEVVVGCFILFSARLIAGALLGTVQPVAAISAPSVSAPMPYVPNALKPVPYDPYAGASVPHTDQERPILK